MITIHPYTTQSADHIIDLILPIQRDEFGLAITRQDQPDLAIIPAFYQNGIGNFWVAEDEGKIIGTIALKDIGNRQVALRKMFVHPDYRGREKGVAHTLLQKALAWATLKDLKDIFLGTTSKFLAAHRFYEKNGFIEIDKQTLPATFPIMAIDSKFYHYRCAKA